MTMMSSLLSAAQHAHNNVASVRAVCRELHQLQGVFLHLIDQVAGYSLPNDSINDTVDRLVRDHEIVRRRLAQYEDLGSFEELAAMTNRVVLQERGCIQAPSDISCDAQRGRAVWKALEEAASSRDATATFAATKTERYYRSVTRDTDSYVWSVFDAIVAHLPDEKSDEEA